MILLALSGCATSTTKPTMDTATAVTLASTAALGLCGYLPGNVIDDDDTRLAFNSIQLATTVVDYLSNAPDYPYERLVAAVGSINPAVAPYASAIASVMMVAVDQVSIKDNVEAAKIARAVLSACRLGIEQTATGGIT